MPDLSELMKSTTNRLLLANVVVYILIEALFAGERSGFELYYWQKPEFQLWQLFSSMFLHANLTHLALNMLALWSFGRVLERVWGGQRFLMFYLVCGVGAGLLHLAVANYQYQEIVQQILAAGFTDKDISSLLHQGRGALISSNLISEATIREIYGLYNRPAVGASGAIYGVLVAFALLFPNFKIMLIFMPIPIASKFFVPVLLLIDLTAGITGFSIFNSNIAHFAHIGGALVGFLLLQFWLKQRP